MKIIISILFLFIAIGSSPELSQMRKNYPKANASEEITNELFKELASIKNPENSILTAYKGAVYTLKAKFAKGVKTKKEYFKVGVELIESSIAAAPDNIEIRCLRLSVQENSPKIVGYKSNIKEDKEFILAHFKGTSSNEVKEFVKNFAQQSSLFEDSEKQLF